MTLARLRVAAGLVLVATSLSSCGSSDTPKTASTADFCDAYNSLYTAFTETDPDDTASVIKALKTWAQRMKDVGAPADMPASAKRGLELLVSTAADLDEDATDEELSDLGASFSAGQQKDGEAFDDWAGKSCPNPLGDSPSGSATGSAS